MVEIAQMQNWDFNGGPNIDNSNANYCIKMWYFEYKLWGKICILNESPHVSPTAPSHKRERELSHIEAMVQMVVKEPLFLFVCLFAKDARSIATGFPPSLITWF